jgi:probable DNA repair protein
MVTHALDLLRWTQNPLPLERISALLRSPFFGSSADSTAAARFDAHTLRRHPSLLPELDLEAVRRLAAQDARHTPSSGTPLAWLQAVADLLSTRQRSAATRTHAARTFADCAELFRAILRAANWPADSRPDRTATASEFETARAWDSTLDLLATLDFRGHRVSLADATKALEHLAQSARINAPARAPIQIMRPDDTEGSVFDAIVLLRATDDAWPEPQHLHPLLGWPLQQDLHLPGADAARDAERARTRADSLLARTTNILITSAEKNTDGPLRPSPLLQHLNLGRIDAAELIDPPTTPSPLVEELVPDDTPLPPLPALTLRGGSNVLKLQAACGFLAFAELRLNAKSPEPDELGLDAGERGNLVHNALEAFWRETTSQAELSSLSTDERTARLNRAIDEAFAKIKVATEIWSIAYLALQRDRLHTLLARWLDRELERGPFTVLSREAKAEIDIGPLRLQLRPDRIDRVEGGFALVDYKTGASSKPANWLGDRPDDPQLPLYALLAEPGELKALLFAHIRPGTGMKWSGLEAETGILPPSRAQTVTEMDTRIAEWRDVLSTLAANFASGRADVSPKSYTINCKHCGQRLLCRLDPTPLLNTADEDNEEDSDG